TRIIFARSPAGRFFRDRIVAPLLRTRSVRNRMIGRLSQLDVNYRVSRLARHQDERGVFSPVRVRAGDRVPDIAFRRAESGEAVTLFDLLGQLRPLALIGAGRMPAHRLARLVAALNALGIDAFPVTTGEDPAPDSGGLVDAHGDFQRCYGARGEFLY